MFVTNPQLTSGKLIDMAYKTIGVHLPANLWALPNRVVFERARTRGGRARVSALPWEIIERNRKDLEFELGNTVR